MYRKFSRLLILQSLWRAACEDSYGLFETTSQICCECLALCSPCRLRAPAVCLFTRCWSNVASCWAFSASGCSGSFSSFSILPVLTLWWCALGEGSRPTINHHTTGGYHPLWGCLFWIPGGPESPKRSVLRSTCWEEGGYSWRQRVGVGNLSEICAVR